MRTVCPEMGTFVDDLRFLHVCKKILIVEDDPLNRMLFADVLESEGFTVAAVMDERETLSVARQYRPHLIIMDIQLPFFSGLTLIRQLRRDPQLAHIPILTVTGHVGAKEEEAVRATGATAFMAKPVSIKALTEAVFMLLPPCRTDENSAELSDDHSPVRIRSTSSFTVGVKLFE